MFIRRPNILWSDMRLRGAGGVVPGTVAGNLRRSRMRTLENFSQATFRESTFFQALR